MNSLTNDTIHYTAFDTLNPCAIRSPINQKSKKTCNNNIIKFICISPLFVTLFLLLLSSIYTNVMLQLFLLEVNNKIGNYNFEKMTELYYNVSHNAYVMCTNDPLLTNPALCYLS